MKSIEHALAVHETYEFLFRLPFSIQRKNVVFSALLAGEPWSWRVIGISKAALEALAKTDFRYAKATICRAHIVDRFETSKIIFSGTSPLSKERFFEIMLENGRTIITTKSENKVGGAPPSYLPIDPDRGLFANKLISFVHGAAERAYLRDLHSQFAAGRTSLIPLSVREKAASGT